MDNNRVRSNKTSSPEHAPALESFGSRCISYNDERHLRYRQSRFNETRKSRTAMNEGYIDRVIGLVAITTLEEAAATQLRL